MAKKTEALEMPQAAPAEDFAELVKALVDMREVEAQAARGGANYEAVRKHRRESEALWERARFAVYGPKPVDNKPRTKAEAERWERNAARVAARRQE